MALSSGAARGLAHIGVIKELVANDVPIDYVAGTSGGAFIGALFCAGMGIDEIGEIARNSDWKLVARMFVPAFSRSGFVRGKRIKEFLRTLVGDININDLEIPFAAVATSLETGEEIVIDKGSLIEAVRASIATPIIFTPVSAWGRLLMDGGLVNPLPISVVKKMGADVVIAVKVFPTATQRVRRLGVKSAKKRVLQKKILSSTVLNNYLARYLKNEVEKSGEFPGTRILSFEKNVKLSPGMINILMQTFSIVENQIYSLRIHHEKPDVLLEPQIDSTGYLEFFRAGTIINAGEKAASGSMPVIKQIIKNLNNS